MELGGKALDPVLDFLIVEHNLMWLVHGEERQIFFGSEAGKEVMQDKPRSHTFRHPPPYLGIVSSRYSFCAICAEPEEKKEQSISLGQGTDYKTSTGKNIFINSMEMLYAFVRNRAWTSFHPPPLFTNECRKIIRRIWYQVHQKTGVW